MIEHEVAMAIHHLARCQVWETKSGKEIAIKNALQWLHEAQKIMDAIRKEKLYENACQDIIDNPKEWSEMLGTPVGLIHEMYSEEEVIHFYEKLTE